MATIEQLMPYLEQGYIAYDPVRHAYLYPKKQEDGTLMFEWTAYEMEGGWSGPDTHSHEYVLTWKSSGWGILYETKSGGGTSENDTDKPERIEQAIANGSAYKDKSFREEPTLSECPYCHQLHDLEQIQLCPLNPKNVVQ